MIYRILAILTIVAVIVASILLSRQQSATPAATAVQPNEWDEGYSAQNAQLVETGADGLPLYTLNAATMRQLPNADQVQLTQVQMTFRDPNGDPWTATADRGEVEQGSQHVQLAGDVHISGTIAGAAGEAQLFTATLSVDLRTDLVNTKDPVQMLWGGRQLSSTGVVANLKDDRVQLESAVHGTYSQ
ncbi:MAG: LPS export ABC transporter periplasmic protein LptC [Steroidobacteraceae bacterium]